MAITAQSIIRRVVETIQDNTSIRWPIAELVRYLNDGQREIILYRPDAMVTKENVTLALGTRQSLPAAGSKLIDITRNVSASKRAIRIINREILDAQTPVWHGLAGVVEILHYMYDPRDPKVFYVYPPALTTSIVEVIFSSLPTDIAEPADGALYTAVTGNISVPDIYGNLIQNYIQYRVWNKDSEYAGNAARSQTEYGVFTNALGAEIKATVMVAPQSQGNPNRTAGAGAV